jgi:hypothetical protein
VDVLDPELLALLQETLRLGALERPATRALIPLGRIELDALEVVALGVVLELLQALSGVRTSTPGYEMA